MSRQTKPVPMCCVSIDYHDFLMPAASGMKIVELMQQAVRCDGNYSVAGRKYILKGTPAVEYRAVQPNQVETPNDALEPANEGSSKLLRLPAARLK